MKLKSTLRSFLSTSLNRRHRVDSELPGETAPAESGGKGGGNKKPAAKKAAKETKKPAAKGKGAKKEAAKPAKKEKAAKAPKEKSEGRKPRVEGRVDLVFRSGPERAIALKVAETHKAGEAEKVDNCTVGFRVTGAKAEALHSAYVALRDEWRKAQDALTEKFLAKAASK